jgi:hypothetical protein
VSTLPSIDARAVVRALDALTTQVRRLADTTVAPVGEATDPTDDDPATAPERQPAYDAVYAYIRQLGDEMPGSKIQRNAIIWHAVAAALDAMDASPATPEQAAAADEDPQRTTRRDALRNLLHRIDRGVTRGIHFTPDEARLLRQHVEAEIRDADTARAVARSNLRHVQTIVPEIDRLTAELEDAEQRATGFLAERDQAQAAIERVRAAVHIADDEDRTDWQRGFRACSVVALGALDEPTVPAASEVAATTYAQRAEELEDALIRIRPLASMFDGLHTLLVTSSRDWGQYRVDAWLWAVLVGWDCEEQHEHNGHCNNGAAMQEMADRHGWDDVAVDKARRYRDAVRAVEHLPAPPPTASSPSPRRRTPCAAWTADDATAA